MRIVEAREKLSLGAIERAADFSIIEQNQAVRTKPVPEFEVAANRHRLQVGGKALGLPGPAADGAAHAGQGATDLGAKELQAPFDDGAAQQQAAVHHDAIAPDAGNRGSLKAHNLGFGVGEAEFPAYGAVLDPQRTDLRCAVQIDRAGHERALDMDAAVVNGGAVLAAERQEAQEVRPDLVLLRGRAWPGPGEGAWFAFEGSVQ